jgi:hypothetical protein
MSRVAVALMVAVLSLGATTACDTAKPPESGPSSPGVSGSAAALTGTVCDLITLEAVSQFMGQPAQVDESDQAHCIWVARTDGIYTLHLQVFNERTYYAPDEWGSPEPIPGIGQEAFLVRQGSVGTVAGFWDGHHAVFLSYATVVGPGNSADKADLLVLLLSLVADRM